MGRPHNIHRVKLRWMHWTEWIKATSLQLETRFKINKSEKTPVRTCTFLAFVHEVALLFSKMLWVITESFVYCNGIMLKQSVCLYKRKPLWISAYTNFCQTMQLACIYIVGNHPLGRTMHTLSCFFLLWMCSVNIRWAFWGQRVCQNDLKRRIGNTQRLGDIFF